MSIESPEYTAFLRFAEERHRIWERRQAGEPAPWTLDPVLAGRKFTNAFRVLDHGSQFFITELLEDALSPEEVLARALLFRFTNTPEMWCATRDLLGHYPLLADMTSDLASVWAEWHTKGTLQVFSGAYMIRGIAGEAKAFTVMRQAANVGKMQWLSDVITKTGSQEVRYRALLEYPGVAKFLAMQVLTDYGYSRFGPLSTVTDTENLFIVAGPGAVSGANHLAPHLHPTTVIKLAQMDLMLRDRISLELPDGRRRLPSYMDTQNLLCEWSKYIRFRSRPRHGVFRPAHPGAQPTPVYPTHW